MQEVKQYPHGTFSWVDLTSTDQAAAREFYTGVFGWEAVDIPIDESQTYTMFQLEGRDVAGAGQMSAEQMKAGMPSVWNSYIAVDNLEDATAKVAELGGTVVAPPFDVMESGRMSVLQDPTGAFVSLWAAKAHIGAKLVNIPGALVWNELATPDAAKAGDFFTGLFGWKVTKDESDYHLFWNGERVAGGMMQMTPEWGDIPPHWMVYFAVEDVDATLAKIKELGGTVVREPWDAPGTGRMAVVGDPQGGVFSVIAMENADPPPGY